MPTPKIGSPENKPQFQFLSNQSREILELAAKRHIKDLDKLHWGVLPYIRNKTIKGRKIQNEILTEIAKDTRKTEQAIKELNETFA